MKEKLLWIKEIGESVIISLVIVLLIRAFLFQPFFVKGQSMEPNFDDGNYLIVDRITPRISKLERGEVIVFRAPVNQKDFYIKRIIGLPGERVVIKNGIIKIYNKSHKNGFVLDESSYLGKDVVTQGDIDVTLNKNEVFVLGDNRVVSYDSRMWGPLNIKNIIGVVRLRAWPVNEFSIFKYDYSQNVKNF